jgi:hypothetical protein
MIMNVVEGVDQLTDNDKLCRHEESEDMEDDLKDGPFLGLEEPPGAGAEDEGVPCGYCERADEKVFVGGQVGGQVERGREERRNVRGAHAGWAELVTRGDRAVEDGCRRCRRRRRRRAAAGERGRGRFQG